MKEKKIEAIKTWAKLQSVQDIQVFLGFGNVYQRFIQAFSRITSLLTSILEKILQASIFSNARELNRAADSGVDDSNEINRKEVGENLSKINLCRARFFTPKARVTFICLREAFTKASIFHYFDLKRYIRIEIDASSFAIRGIFSKLTWKHVANRNRDYSIFEIK